MAHQGSTRAFHRLFPKKHVPAVLDAVLSCCEGLRKHSEKESENALTLHLYTKLILVSPFRDGPLDVSPQPQVVQDSGRDGMVVGQPDLKVTGGFGAHVYFAIEAKRLHVLLPSGKRASGASKYVDEGMMRFVSGLYAPRMSSSAMLGYVFDGDIKRARETIAKAVQSKATALKLQHGVMRSSGILPAGQVSETQHDFAGRAFVIYHLLVAV